MKARNVTIHAAALVLLLAGSASAQKVAAAGAKPVKCTNPFTTVAVVATFDGSALYQDIPDKPYQEGVDGVYNTVVYACPGASGDATMGLITSRRSLGFRFPKPIAGSATGDVPVWADSSFLAKPFMNVRKILWNRVVHPGDPYYRTFTTRVGFSMWSGPRDSRGVSYKLIHAPFSTDSGVVGTTEENYFLETTPATVQDIPGTCRDPGVVNGTLDSWIVTVAPSVGTLMRDVNNGAPVPAGQYTMPFQLLIKAKTCLPF